MIIDLERTGTGDPLVFIHGAGGSGFSWRFQKEGLREHAEVIALDLPGHGSASGPGCSSVEEYRGLCLEAFRRAGIDRCFLAGHSMGGAVAISLALAYPNMVEGLILIGTGAKLRVLPAILDGVRERKAETVRMIATHALSQGSPQALREVTILEMLKCDSDTIYGDFYACDRFNVMDRLGDLTLPTLIICGTEDRLTPPPYSRFLNEGIAGSQLVLIEGAGHMVMLEKPLELNDAIATFLSGRSRD